MWVLVDDDLHQLKLSIPRIFYVNSRVSRHITTSDDDDNTAWRNVSKILPRATPAINLYEYSVPETIFKEHAGYVNHHVHVISDDYAYAYSVMHD